MSQERLADVATVLGPDALLLASLRGQDRLSTPFAYDLELVSEDPAVDLNALLGTAMTVTLELSDGGQRYFHGVVARIGRHEMRGSYMVYRATLKPWLWLLSHTSDCRIFQQMTVPDIIKEVFRDHGFSDFEESLTGTYRTWDYLVQYRESSLNFVSRIMEQEGIYYYFVHEADRHTLVLSDSYSAHGPVDGYGEIPLHPRADGGQQRERDHLQTWSVRREITSGAFTTTDFDFQRPKADLTTKVVSPMAHERADFEVYDYPGEYIEVSDGDVVSRTRIEARQVAHAVRTGAGDVRGLMSGALFTLTKHPDAAENIEYLVLACQYDIVNNLRETGDLPSGTGVACQLTAAESSAPFRPPQSTPKPIIPGPHTATVVGPAGEEIWTDEYARIKVQFHWDRLGSNDENSSCWVRVSQYWAGPGLGSIHIPRIGQEVIVEFLEGDPDRPIVTGRVYNADNMPPYALPDNATQSGWKSRSSKGGNPDNANELRFEDKMGAEQVYMQAEKNMDTLVKDAQTLTVGTTRNKTIGTDETTDVGDNRTETVGIDETITIGANRTEDVGADETITIGANRTESVGADETITIGANRTESVGASEAVTIAADQTLSVGGSQTETVGTVASRTVGAAETVSVGAARTTSIGAADVLNVGAAYAIEVGAAMSTNVGAVMSTDVGGSQSLSVGSDRTTDIGADDALKIKGKLVIDAGDEVTIKCGAATIVMKKNGDVQVKGKDLKVEGSGKVNVKAGGDVVIKGSKIGLN